MIMKIDNILLDKLTTQAQESYYDDLESGTVILEMKDGLYEPISPEDILSMYI